MHLKSGLILKLLPDRYRLWTRDHLKPVEQKIKIKSLRIDSILQAFAWENKMF